MSTEAVQLPPKKVSQLKSFLSGGIGGACLVFAGHPFDLIKVRVQTSAEAIGAWQCAKDIIKKDGMRGMYRGMLAPLIGVTPIFAVSFWGYDMGQRLARWGSGTVNADVDVKF